MIYIGTGDGLDGWRETGQSKSLGMRKAYSIMSIQVGNSPFWSTLEEKDKREKRTLSGDQKEGQDE
jgi:hypothetical protein